MSSKLQHALSTSGAQLWLLESIPGRAEGGRETGKWLPHRPGLGVPRPARDDGTVRSSCTSVTLCGLSYIHISSFYKSL